MPDPISDASGMMATQPIASSSRATIGSSDVYTMTSKPSATSVSAALSVCRTSGYSDVRVAEHFELDEPVIVEQLAREPQRAYRIVGGVAARAVRQVREFGRRQHVEERRRVRVLPDVRAADRDGDDLRAGRVDRRARLREVLVLAGADEQARAVRPARDRQALGRSDGGVMRGVHARILRPPVRRQASCRPRSTSADGADDFQPVAVLERRVGVAAPRNDLSVALDRDAFALQSQLANQIRHVRLSACQARVAAR